MNKKAKIILIIVMSMIIVLLMSILIYSNFIAKDNSNDNLTNPLENGITSPDNSLEVEPNTNSEYSFENLTITEFATLYNEADDDFTISFKITNNTGDLLEKFYILLSLNNAERKNNIEIPIEIPRIDKDQTRYISYTTDVDVSEVTSFSFEKIDVQGKGN